MKLVEHSQLLGLVSLSFIPPAQLIIGDLMQRHTDKLTIMLQQLTETQFNLSKKKKKKKRNFIHTSPEHANNWTADVGDDIMCASSN